MPLAVRQGCLPDQAMLANSMAAISLLAGSPAVGPDYEMVECSGLGRMRPTRTVQIRRCVG